MSDHEERMGGAFRIAGAGGLCVCGHVKPCGCEQFRPQDGKSVAVSVPSTEQPTPYTEAEIAELEVALFPASGTDAFVVAADQKGLFKNWRRRLLATARQGLADSELAAKARDWIVRADTARELAPDPKEAEYFAIIGEMHHSTTPVRRHAVSVAEPLNELARLRERSERQEVISAAPVERSEDGPRFEVRHNPESGGPGVFSRASSPSEAPTRDTGYVTADELSELEWLAQTYANRCARDCTDAGAPRFNAILAAIKGRMQSSGHVHSSTEKA